MSVTQRIIKNTAFLISGQIFAKIVNLALVLILAHIFGVTGFGIYSFAFAYTSLFVLLVHLGINNLLVREVARNKERAEDFIATTFPVLLVMAAFLLMLINLIAFISNWVYLERIIIFIFSFYAIFETICRYFIAVIRAHEKMEYEALITVGERLVLLLVTLIIWFFSFDLIILVTGFTLTQFIRLIWLIGFIKLKFVPIKLRWDTARIFLILKEAYPFALISIFATISTRIDLVMLRIFHSPELAGIYNAARKLIESLTFIPENIYLAVFPVLAVYYLKDKSYFDLTFQRVFLILCVLAFPLTSAIYIFAPHIIDLVFEPEFSEAAIPLQWLAIALGLIFIRHALAVILNSIGKQHLFSIFTGIGMFINVGLNLLLIPEYKVFGAALATVISELITTFISLLSVRRFVRFGFIYWNLIRLTIITIFFVICIIFLKDLHFVLAGLISIIFYSILLYFFKIISKNDFTEIKNLFKRKPQNLPMPE